MNTDMKYNEFLNNEKKLVDGDLVFCNEMYDVYGFDNNNTLDTNNFAIKKRFGRDKFVDGELENNMFCHVLTAIGYISGKRLSEFKGSQFFADIDKNIFLIMTTNDVKIQ